MLLCARCGTNGVTLPCPMCGWEGEDVAQPHRLPKRRMPLVYAAMALLVTGAVTTAVLSRLLGIPLVAGGFALLARSRGDRW